MNNKKTVRLRPEIKEFLAIIGLGKYILAFEACIFFVSLVLCAFVLGEGAPVNELIKLTGVVALFVSGAMVVIATLLDIAVELTKWFATHRVTLLKIEEKNVRIL